ncbi:periplasmic sugar-binding protein [Actinobacillus equuli]|nr:periplasmic sugar-binding protein [Actinobacillus equuli]
MALMRKEIDKEANQLKDVKLLMNDSQNTQSIQNDQVDVLLSKGVKALAINLVDPSASKTIIDKAKAKICQLYSSIKTREQKRLQAMTKLITWVQIRKNQV